MLMKYYAHSLENEPTEKWQLLEDHLKNVSRITAEFAAQFNAENWGLTEGLFHDVGKGTKQWQAYIRKANKITDEFSDYYEGHPQHALVGGQWLFSHSKEAGKLLAYCISGHHGGLPNWSGSVTAALEEKIHAGLPDISVPLPEPKFPDGLPFLFERGRQGFQLQFFTRMLFSCLVDADFLDTEAVLDPGKSSWRSCYPEIQELHDRFWKNFKKLRDSADINLNVNKQREIVLENCLECADMEPGLFSLTVPTGGGKTLASLAFALKHAVLRGKRRIIYVIPFTSIIEQNADVFRAMLGDDAVLEHHCNYVIDDSDWKIKLASENWDAPIIVTTNVQFFDSFYASKPSKCRKLHNVANSIVIFDEIQAIPVEKLKPCLEIIKELSSSYDVSSVLCTATQPCIEATDQFESGLRNVREIVEDIPGLFKALKRTEEVFVGEFRDQEIAEKLFSYDQVLCIVNTRRQALNVFNGLPDSEDNFHLSALMYPKHRTEVLRAVRERLCMGSGIPCRVVSTQLIEAGVDIDFPCVFREVSGIDSIAQAAGRCNRNGLSKKQEKVYVFRSPQEERGSAFRQAIQSAEKLFERYEGKLTDPECVNEYYRDYFWKNESYMDEDNILDLCRAAQTLNIQFREIAEFQMINSITIPIVVALEEEALALVQKLHFVEHTAKILRRLQQYSVQVYPYQFEKLKSWLDNPLPDIWVLGSHDLYSKVTGLICEEPEGNAFFA